MQRRTTRDPVSRCTPPPAMGRRGRRPRDPGVWPIRGGRVMATPQARLVSVTEARRRWGALMLEIRQGGVVVLTRRHTPVAVLEGLAQHAARRVASGVDEPLTLTPALKALWHDTVHALGDEARARRWLVRRRSPLGDRTPIEAAVDGDLDRVHQLLAAIA